MLKTGLGLDGNGLVCGLGIGHVYSPEPVLDAGLALPIYLFSY